MGGTHPDSWPGPAIAFAGARPCARDYKYTCEAEIPPGLELTAWQGGRPGNGQQRPECDREEPGARGTRSKRARERERPGQRE